MAAKQHKHGLPCPECGSRNSRVYKTRLRAGGATGWKIVRIRRCQKCERRFVTTERVTG